MVWHVIGSENLQQRRLISRLENVIEIQRANAFGALELVLSGHPGSCHMRVPKIPEGELVPGCLQTAVIN